ncbi:MAG: caspase family protein [bacterium]
MIGVDAYQGGVAPLTTAVRDARGIARLLADAQGYQVTTLLDEQASRAALLQALEVELPARLGPDDRVLVYYAGHGAALDGDDGPEGFLLPQDAQGDTSTLLPMARVAAALKALPCRHVLLVLDCCFAGAFRWSSMRSFAPRPKVLYRRRYERFVSDRAAQVLTSAAANQKALDVFDGLTIGQRPVVAGHSPFAAALMAGLNGAADVAGPSGEADGVITANELYQYVRDVVEGATEERGALQTPGLWPLPGHGRGEYVFHTDGPLVLPEDPRLDPAANPWRGLEAYGAEHAALFFGREAAIDEIVGRVEAAALVCVLGASGVGKSSVVQAGVLPRLQRAGYALIGPVRPGGEPHATVGPALAAARQATSPTVLVLDQFEEMFTACRAPAERAAVLALIAELVENPGKTTVVLTLRADFEAAFLATPLGPAIQAARCPVGAMTREALRQVVLGPADERALYFEPPTLVDRLVEDVALVPGGLAAAVVRAVGVVACARWSGRGRPHHHRRRLRSHRPCGGCLRRAESLYVATDDAGRHALRRVLLAHDRPGGRRVALPQGEPRRAAGGGSCRDAQVEARAG